MRALVLVLACLSVAAAPVDLTHRLRLDNGVEALVVPREGSLLAALLVAVKAGSRHETAATAGVAHLLEHLVFEGTEARGRAEIFRWVYGIGGYLNGFTRDDFTGYLLMGPPAELPAMARLLAELLSGARLSPDALAGVKAVVLEEPRHLATDPAAITPEVARRAARHARLEAARLTERIHYFAMWAAPFLVAGRPDLVLAEPAAPAPDALRAVLARIVDGGYVALLPDGEASSAQPGAASSLPARALPGATPSSSPRTCSRRAACWPSRRSCPAPRRSCTAACSSAV